MRGRWSDADIFREMCASDSGVSMFIFSPALLTGFNWVGRDTDSLGLVAAVISCYGRCAPNARGVIQQWSRVRNMTWDFFPVLCKHGFGDAEDVTCRLLWRPTTSLTHILADMAAEMSRRASRIPPHDIYGGSRVPNVGSRTRRCTCASRSSPTS